MVARGDDRHSAETARVSQDECAAVVEHETDPNVRRRGDVALGVAGIEDAEDPGHPEMDHQLRGMRWRRAREGEEQELATALDGIDATAEGSIDVADPPGGVGVTFRPDHRPAGDQRHQLTAYGLDLGKLWHTLRLLIGTSLP
jgi:hypothetical protein